MKGRYSNEESYLSASPETVSDLISNFGATIDFSLNVRPSKNCDVDFRESALFDVLTREEKAEIFRLFSEFETEIKPWGCVLRRQGTDDLSFVFEKYSVRADGADSWICGSASGVGVISALAYYTGKAPRVILEAVFAAFGRGCLSFILKAMREFEHSISCAGKSSL